MTVISVRIDDKLKKRMEKFPYVSWSEIVRQEIEKAIERFESRNLAEALLLNEKVKKKFGGDSTELIRRWRDRRHGEGGG